MGSREKNLSFPEEVSEFVWAATHFTLKMLALLNLENEQVRGLARALYALGFMPAATPGIDVVYSIALKGGDEQFSEMRYWQICVSDTVFEICSGGSVYNAGVGSDTVSGYSFWAEADGQRYENQDIYYKKRGDAETGEVLYWLHDTEEALQMNPIVDVTDRSDPQCMEL